MTRYCPGAAPECENYGLNGAFWPKGSHLQGELFQWRGPCKKAENLRTLGEQLGHKAQDLCTLWQQLGHKAENSGVLGLQLSWSIQNLRALEQQLGHKAQNLRPLAWKI